MKTLIAATIAVSCGLPTFSHAFEFPVSELVRSDRTPFQILESAYQSGRATKLAEIPTGKQTLNSRNGRKLQGLAYPVQENTPVSDLIVDSKRCLVRGENILSELSPDVAGSEAVDKGPLFPVRPARPASPATYITLPWLIAPNSCASPYHGMTSGYGEDYSVRETATDLVVSYTKTSDGYFYKVQFRTTAEGYIVSKTELSLPQTSTVVAVGYRYYWPVINPSNE